MCPRTSPDDEYVLICGVPWQAYEQILEALGEFHLRHTYDRGTLEMRRILYGVPVDSYRRFLQALPEHHLRHTYDGWTLEMMTPRIDHEWIAELIGRMLEAMAFALDVPIQSVGSTTLSAAEGGRGLQPDKSYYIGKEGPFLGRETYRPGRDPPPNLVIEVDVTNTSIPRLPLYAQIGVLEIWRHDGRRVAFYRLGPKVKYRSASHSLAFPFLRPADVTRFLNRRRKLDEHAVVRAFVQWAEKAHHKKIDS